MKVFIEKRFIPRQEYESFISEFSGVEFVHDLSDKEIEVFFGLNQTLIQIDLEEYHRLKWIQLFMAGFDNVDVESIKARGILVSHARDIFSKTIAEDVISKILYFNRDLKTFTEQKQTKTWAPIWKEKEICRSIIGIVGTGSIGKEVAKRCQAFEPSQVIGYRTKNEPVTYFDRILTGDEGLNELMRVSDYVILAVPLNDQTLGMIDQKKINLMKQDALLVNVSRGKVIVQSDLVRALEANQIRGAALDVFDPEPLPEDSALWTLDNCFITPHNASSSEHMVDRLFTLTKRNLNHYLKGETIEYLL